MSSTNPPTGGASRRRRIAGERKGTRPPGEGGPTPETPDRAPDQVTRETVPPTTPETRPRREARAVPTAVLAALGVAAVLLVAFAASGFSVDGVGVGAWRQVDEESQVETAERAAPAAAERAAAAILAYSHESLEADRDNAAKFMTESYRTEYLDTFGLVLDNAPKVQAVVEAEVKASGVVHADPARANVLLFVNQTTTSTANSGEPQTALNRVVMQMARSGDTWLVDDITTY